MYDNFFEKVKGALDAEQGIQKDTPTSDQIAKPFGQALMEAAGGDSTKLAILKSKTLLPIYKSLGTTDISALRLVSVSDRIPVKRNEETKFLNWLESRGNFPEIQDYQFRIIERDINSETADLFNVDATSLPAQKDSIYRQRYNTVTAVGNTLKVSFMTSAIAEQQMQVRVMEQQIDDQILRIRIKQNQLLLSNVETVAESPNNVPQLGGFITRSTLNNHSAGGGNLTNSLLQLGTNDIASALGYDKQLIMFTNANQVPVIDDLMINRYPGQNSASHMQLLDAEQRMMLEQFKVPVATMYMPRPGHPFPVVQDRHLPSGTSVLFVGNLPRMARFTMEGRTGPFILARPEPTLYELVLCFDLFTLDDPVIESRVIYTNHL